MSTEWVVVLWPGGRDGDEIRTYGPFTDARTAQHFADFLTVEVDPATVHQMSAPVNELLSWYHNIHPKQAT